MLLTARLLNTVAKDLQIPTPHLYAWTDSTIVLGWLNNSAGNWKIFVSNRISQVLSVIPSSQWRHVPSLENPADHASRGLLPSDLLQSKLWWEGPPWLKLSASFWPPPVIARMQSSLPEVRANSAVCHESIEEDHFPWKKFSSFKVLLRIAAWCRRFGYNCRAQLSERILDPVLTPEEILYIQHVLLQLAQDESFPGMVAALQEGKKPSGTKSLLSLEPFLGKDMLIRVGGRLKHSGLPETTIHPILLLRTHMSDLFPSPVLSGSERTCVLYLSKWDSYPKAVRFQIHLLPLRVLILLALLC